MYEVATVPCVIQYHVMQYSVIQCTMPKLRGCGAQAPVLSSACEWPQGDKYDNGERFDLRLPYADQGWVGEGDEEEPVDFFKNLLSGGKLQREADAERERRQREEE